MNRQEYKAWWRETRIEAHKIANQEFAKSADVFSVHFPYFPPFYGTTKENMEWKMSKQIANSLASIHDQPEPYPEEGMHSYIIVRRSVCDEQTTRKSEGDRRNYKEHHRGSVSLLCSP